MPLSRETEKDRRVGVGMKERAEGDAAYKTRV